MPRLIVTVRNFTCELVVGLRPHEQNKVQKVVINIDVEVADQQHHFMDPKEITTAHTFDYSRLIAFLREDLPKDQPYFLLETLATHIAQFCHRSPRVERVKVSVIKPDAYPEAAGAGVVLEL